MERVESEDEEDQFITAEGPSTHHQPGAEHLSLSEFSLAPVIQQIQNIKNFISRASDTASQLARYDFNNSQT